MCLCGLGERESPAAPLVPVRKQLRRLFLSPLRNLEMEASWGCCGKCSTEGLAPKWCLSLGFSHASVREDRSSNGCAAGFSGNIRPLLPQQLAGGGGFLLFREGWIFTHSGSSLRAGPSLELGLGLSPETLFRELPGELYFSPEV